MRTISLFLLSLIGISPHSIAQEGRFHGHTALPHDHTKSICFGYALTRALGYDETLIPPPECNPAKTFAGAIPHGEADPFEEHLASELSDVEPGDILRWANGAHVAFVVAVPTPFDVGTITVDHVDHEDTDPERGIRVSNISKGTVDGFYRLKTTEVPVYVQVKNDFGAGNVLAGKYFGSDDLVPWPSNSEFKLPSRATLKIRCISDQSDAFGDLHDFSSWLDNRGQQSGSSQEMTITVSASGAIFTAITNKTVVVSGTRTVQAGDTLTIGPNDGIAVNTGSSIVACGKLIIQGVQGVPKVMSATSWQGIRFEGAGADGSNVQYCDIVGATSPIISTNVSSLSISHVKVTVSSFGYDAALRFINSSPTITDTEIIGQSDSWNGIRFASGSTGSISNSIIRDCGAGNGIVIEGGSNPVIQNVTVQNNRYHGIILVNNYIEGSGGGDPLPIAAPVIEGQLEEPPPSSYNGPMVRLTSN